MYRHNVGRVNVHVQMEFAMLAVVTIIAVVTMIAAVHSSHQ